MCTLQYARNYIITKTCADHVCALQHAISSAGRALLRVTMETSFERVSARVVFLALNKSKSKTDLIQILFYQKFVLSAVLSPTETSSMTLIKELFKK